MGVRGRSGILVLGVALSLAGCATPTPYQPAPRQGYGYSERQIEGDRWRVVFRANAATEPDMASFYLLTRAAELTLAAGMDYFVLSNEHVVPETTLFADMPRPPVMPTPIRVEGGIIVGGAPAGFEIARGGLETISRFTVYADIQARAGKKPKDDPMAYDARDVLARSAATSHTPAK